MTTVAETVDLRSIGWWIKDLDDREYGPWSRSALLQFWASGIITRDVPVRHNFDFQWQSAAETLGHPPETAQTGTVPQKTLPTGVAAQGFREGPLACIKHQAANAVNVCFRCHGPVCARCQYKPTHRMCRRCHASLYNRRMIAGIIDYWLPGVMFVGGISFLVALHDPKKLMEATPLINAVVIVVTLILTAYLVLKEKIMSGGRSFGKAVTGLRVVDFETGEPLKVVQCVKRNLLCAFFIVPIVQLIAKLWWIIDVSRPWYDPLQRRWFDKFSQTWVVDAPYKLDAVRQETAPRIQAR